VAGSTVVLAASLVIPITVISALNGGLPAIPFWPGHASPPPAAGGDPGTYQAGRLRVPRTLGGKPVQTPSSRSDVNSIRKQRDELSKVTGGAPAVSATYGQPGGLIGITLVAAQGYTDPVAYMGTASPDRVKFSTHGQVHCATPVGIGIDICIRSEQAKALTVVVIAPADDPQQVAGLVEEAWSDLGGG
jgi:hypothetical protein